MQSLEKDKHIHFEPSVPTAHNTFTPKVQKFSNVAEASHVGQQSHSLLLSNKTAATSICDITQIKHISIAPQQQLILSNTICSTQKSILTPCHSIFPDKLTFPQLIILNILLQGHDHRSLSLTLS